MRLSKIKLAGFKSFVDPTTISFPSNLVGVVGPNGCGKSNVIDAVRWVMGESSASRLRGDSITDVIFNGSSARKPVGAATIELLFDNADATIGGQYAKFSEISIKRSVSRDGISTYFLNGTRCRRKDITHVFLGTGLGPRSYSIIEQGMISRLIEAKPEELRVYLEEAAGISKYKDRRRETENRIRHTKDNLERLADLVDEVDKQLKHLDRQARTAERYKRLKAEERRTRAELLALKLRDLDARAAEQERRQAEKENALQAAIAEQRRIEAAMEQARVSQGERSETFNEIQGRYYRIGAEIARLEQSIEHGRELRQRQEQDLEQARAAAREIEDHIEQDRNELDQLELALNELTPDLEQARSREAGSAQSLQRAEEAMAGWQSRWDEFVRHASDVEQSGEVERARIEQLEGQLEKLTLRRERIGEDAKGLSVDEQKEAVSTLGGEEQALRQAAEEADARVGELRRQIATLREQEARIARHLEARREELQKASGRYTSLEALQKAALGEADGTVGGWLEAAGLADRPRLAQRLKVEDGWERAVETVLGSYLQAVCVDDLVAATRSLEELNEGSLMLLEGRESALGGDEGRLAARVGGAPEAVLTQLRRVRTADSLPAALALRDRLEDNDSIITRDGIWLGRTWLRVNREKDARGGILKREQEMRTLKDELREQRVRVETLEKTLHDTRRRLESLEEQRESVQQASADRHRRQADAQARLESARYRLSQIEERIESFRSEVADIDRELEATRQRLEDSRQRLEQSRTDVGSLEKQRSELSSQREQLRGELARVRQQAEQDRTETQAIALRYESRRSSRESASQSLARMKSQLGQFHQREAALKEQLAAGEEPIRRQEEALEAQLRERVEVEGRLAEARRAMEAVEAELRELDQQRLANETTVESARQAVDQVRMAAQEVRVRREGVAEQFGETGFELETVLAEMPEGAAADAWEENLQRLGARIDRLGPINLAAIDEFKEQSERKEYLDAQLADLNEALGTLEGAIRKIDKETRTRFRETYDQVDAGFKRLFPKLFGGGHAYLELTGEDLLSAGVTVMARPPGKRNSTIHLLSGGEKALTAVALVFAIFELNPAPFCMLDEVDAPLDDANVGRFCDIVKEMASQVQFVFITHNKVTMEMARQLTGVTMQEPGVSRLVSVDLDEAVKMAAS